MSIPLDVDKAPRIEEALSSNTPQINTFLRPYMSEALPKGTRNAAAARRYAVETQLSVMTFIERSRPRLGKETMTDDAIKGVRKELRAAISRPFL